MSDRNSSQLEMARQYLTLLEQHAPPAELAPLFSPHFAHHELPNLLNPRGRTLNRAQLLEMAVRARSVVAEQRYEVQGSVVAGNRVALEVEWRGKLASPVGGLPAGATMRAGSAIFLSFEGGQIVAQRNYDCFDPF